MNIPIYEIKLTDDFDGIQCISFVDSPAMEVEMLCFNKQHKIDFQINETEQCITSVVILADIPIYRYDSKIGEYYITFSKDVIKEIAERFNKNGMNNIISLNHDGNEIHDKAVLRELYIKDTDKGIAPIDERFKDVPNGSLFATYHILDTELFNLIKTKGGISMELLSDIKLQEYEDVDIFEYLFEDKKKAFSVSKNAIKRILKQNKQVNIQWGAELLENQQIWGSCKVNGENGIMVYNPNNETWTTYNLNEIEVKVTDKPLAKWNYNAQWKLLINDMNIIIDSVKPTNQEGKNSIDYIMDRNMYVMISYFDETEDGATGFRLCFLSSWGETTSKNGGNEAIRIYEYNGDTKSGFDEGHWRLLLTRRIIDIKAVDYMKPIQTAPLLYNGEEKAGSGINGTMSSVKRVAEFPPKIIWQPEKR